MKHGLLIHPKTEAELNAYLANPAHLLALVGPAGIGRGSIALALVQELLSIDSKRQEQFMKIVRPINGSIGISEARNIQKFLQLKSAGAHSLRRAIIIENADQLTDEAQNALLKIFEEPPLDTIVIITINSINAISATINSRSQQITIRKPFMNDIKTFFTSNKASTDEFDKAYFICGALPGLLSAVLDQETEHPLLNSVKDAKTILGLSKHAKLLRINELVKDKLYILQLLSAMHRIARISLTQASTKNDAKLINRWYEMLKLIMKSEKAITDNANAKLTLTNLFLAL